ncbi:MAG: hypothetical protein KDB26_14580, partial [Microthrixaceae bacterium]|nr:hypothetical protein [Microthrixaceae bacterium]
MVELHSRIARCNENEIKTYDADIMVSRQLSPEDLWYFSEGTERFAYRFLGSHYESETTSFALWAPNARSVSIVGDFNLWNGSDDLFHLRPVGSSGVWAGRVSGVGIGDRYKYELVDVHGDS